MEEIGLYLEEAKEQMEKAVKHTHTELSKVRAGKASPAMLDGLTVEYYGAQTPLGQLAAVNTPDARNILIKPFEKKLIMDIERAIRESDLGINPQNDGEMIRLTVPPLTEERRKALVKQVKNEIEEGKVRIRNIRKDINEQLRKLQKDGAAEDDIKRAEEKVQQFTDAHIIKVEQLMAAKEAELMTV